VARYHGDNDELNLSFNFMPLHLRWEAAGWRRLIETVETELGSVGAWPTWVLSSHDAVRHRTRLGSEARARAAAVLLLTLRGTPFLYAGEELGLEQATIPPDRVVDPGGRDGCRAPIPWDGSGTHGWDGADPWLPWPPDPDTRNAEAQRADPASILHLYRRLLAARRASPALQHGAIALIDSPAGVLAYGRTAADDRRVIAVNTTGAAVSLPGLAASPSGRGSGEAAAVVQVASDGAGEGRAFTGRLGPDQAVILRPGGPAS
jgi:alpha-glucosidase